MKLPSRHGGSFRDPQARLYDVGDRLVKLLCGDAAAGLRKALDDGLLARWIERGDVPATEPLDAGAVTVPDFAPQMAISHERLPFISYPFEWSFGGLADAARLHLRLQMEALNAGLVFRDASAYNVGFRGARPQFLDLGSLRPYRPGEFWVAHEQFCRQFLNPLLLHAHVGVPFQALYRGDPGGLPSTVLADVLPWRTKIRPRVFSHVVLPAWLVRRRADRTTVLAEERMRSGQYSLRAYRATLEELIAWIGSLRPARHESAWSSYEHQCSYSAPAARAKEAFITRWLQTHRPRSIVDIGCNRGRFAELAVNCGCDSVVGLETDSVALEYAYTRAVAHAPAFLPLSIDFADATPDQGWRHSERQSFRRRARFDGVLALAVVHHLALARNIPLNEIIEEIVALAPRGVVEFVAADDPMARRLVALREGTLPDYGWSTLLPALQRVAVIEETFALPDCGRIMVAFRRK